MKKILKTLAVIMVFFLANAFTIADQPNFIGTYGVSEGDPSQIKLTLLKDKTFSYQDFSNPKQKIQVNGNWELKGKTVVLTNYESETAIHNRWKFTQDGQIAKSRKALCFYSLCKID
jgi:hypothetical protein